MSGMKQLLLGLLVVLLRISCAIEILNNPEESGIDYIRGVSLGGHLVPEPFIEPDFWEEINKYCPGAKDIWNVCQCTVENSGSSASVISLMKDHLSNFINLNDLEDKVTRTKINAFRYPISFTYFLNQTQDPDEYRKYASCGVVQDNLLASSFISILQFAQKHQIRVILDLHQVQGCQNGFDNGGRAGVKEFFTDANVQKGINIWQNMMNFLQHHSLLSYIWGFEVVNEPLPTSNDENQFLRRFTETVVNNVIKPKITQQQVVVLQPGPGDSLVSEYESYNLASGIQYVFDFHEYIVFGSLYLNPFDSAISQVYNVAKNDYGATKYPYFVGEWSLATTDCAQYLNGAFGGFDPDYYQKQHQSRSSFNCNDVNQQRSGKIEGFQTCSTIFFNDDNASYGHCNVGQYQNDYNQYKTNMCKLFSSYISGFKANSKNVGYAFWTYTTGRGERRIQQWDYAFAVDQGIINDSSNPTC